MVAVPSAVDTSKENPPSTALSTVTDTVIAPSSSLPLTLAIVTVAVSSLVRVTVPVSVTSILAVLTVGAVSPLILKSMISSASTLVSVPKFTVTVSTSPAVVPSNVIV